VGIIKKGIGEGERKRKGKEKRGREGGTILVF
jgi:hypothetical protein